MNIDDLRAKAKSLGIKHWHVKSSEKLQAELSEFEPASQSETIPTNTDEDNKGFLKNHTFNLPSLQRVAVELGATEIIYRKRKKAFECLKENKTLDFLSVAMF